MLAKFQKWLLIFVSCASVLGGYLATFDLRYAIVLTIIGTFVSFVLSLFFKEPPQELRTQVSGSIIEQVKLCCSYLKTPLVLWLVGFSVLSVLLDHVPYQFYQPYVDMLEIDWLGSRNTTPLLTGFHIAITMLLGAFFSANAVRLSQKFGHIKLLLSSSIVHLVMILLMGVYLSPLVAALAMLRELPNAIKNVTLNALLIPKIESGHRATFLSLKSLAEKGFVGIVLILIQAQSLPENSYIQMSQMILVLFIFCLAFYLFLLLTKRKAI